MIKKFGKIALATLLAWGASAFSAEAGTKSLGFIKATQPCPAFLSMRKETNPGKITLKVGESYAVIDLKSPRDANAVRIRMDGTDFPERWVERNCGILTITGNQDKDKKDPDKEKGVCPIGRCNQPDQEDSFVLSLSWQPAFCESKAGKPKPECLHEDPKGYAATHFTLHGLWPNKNACGTRYGYCGKTVCNDPSHGNDPKWMCQYPEVPWNGTIPKDVTDVMPSIQAGSCLDRHEWYKHGTCAAPWTPQEYFSFAAQLVKEFNNAGMAKIMADHLGKEVNVTTFMDAIDDAFGEGASNRVGLQCAGDLLTGISIQLPANMDRSESLQELLQEAKASANSSCRGNFRVDPAGH
ncbi:MAG: hypothetical protein HQM03_08100 [Magnetococcales bacterium]|nr:hypothetical protein [Magnetococcales bacterium]